MFRIDRRLLQNFDWLAFFAIVGIAVIGVLTIFSATRQPLDNSQSPLFIKQIVWLFIGVCGLVVFVSFDYIWLSRLSIPVYIVAVVLLVIVLITGRVGMGAQRWLNVGPIAFQPSEFFKLAFVIMTARFLSLDHRPISMTQLARMAFIIALPPFILLIKQPDLGTAVVVAAIFFSMLLARGLERKTLIFIIILGLVSLPFLGNILWTGLKDYQKNRIISFIDPEADPSGIGYHINQSKVAIGSGELIGKGFLRGTQGPFRFLPERHTDFIFAVFAEEWGFAGSLALLGLYLFVIMRGLDTARKAKDEFGRMLAVGVTFMFCVYFFVNVGMTLGIMPVVGVPLPFMSYGGTALLSNFIAAGVLINVRTRRFSLFY